MAGPTADMRVLPYDVWRIDESLRGAWRVTPQCGRYGVDGALQTHFIFSFSKQQTSVKVGNGFKRSVHRNGECRLDH